jgi:hypothetical protein
MEFVMLWIGQFAIVAGEVKQETPWIGAYPDRGNGDETSDLYVLVAPALPGSEEFCTEMKDAIGEAYHREKVSLTGGILRSVHAAHLELQGWNKRSLREHTVAAGVSCVAAGEESVYLAQVAPAAAVVMRRGVTEIIKPSLPESRQSLGLEQDPRPEFTALGLETGDRVLLVSPELTDALTEDDFAAVLDSTEENALTELYRRAQGITECAALLIAVVPDPPGGG